EQLLHLVAGTEAQYPQGLRGGGGARPPEAGTDDLQHAGSLRPVVVTTAPGSRTVRCRPCGPVVGRYTVDANRHEPPVRHSPVAAPSTPRHPSAPPAPPRHGGTAARRRWTTGRRRAPR